MSKFSELLKNVFDTTTDGYAADARALKTLNDRIDGLQVAGTPVVDNLTTESATSALSAKQGKILKGLIDLNAPLADPEFTGTATLNGEPLGINANLNGTSYLLVYGTSTPEENGSELVAAYEEAKKMPRYLGELQNTDQWQVYKGQTLLYNNSYYLIGSDKYGDYANILGGSTGSINISEDTALGIPPTTIIVAPGIYDTTGFTPNISSINIVSLTGRYDVIFNGVPSFGITVESGGIVFNPTKTTHTVGDVIDWINSHGSLKNGFVRDVTFNDIDFSNVDFSGSTFSNVKFYQCNLSGASFSSATFLAATRFELIDFASVDFDYAIFDGESGFWGYENISSYVFEGTVAKLMYYGIKGQVGNVFEEKWVDGFNAQSFIYFDIYPNTSAFRWNGTSWERVL